MKKRYSIAFFLTILLYFFLAFLIWPLQKERYNSKRTVTALNLSNLILQKPKPKTLPVRPIAPSPRPQRKSLPLPQPKSHSKSKSKTEKKEKLLPTKIYKRKKENKKIVRYKTVAKQRQQEHNMTKVKTIVKKTIKQKPPSLATFFAQTSKKSDLKGLPKEYRKLYKDEFDSFTKEQKRFLKNNLSRIGVITQKYLYLRGYPYISVKTRQQGTNIVEFYLHPNGDISGLKLIGSSGYEALDKNTIETVKVAYKDYPLPKETTKIRIYVKYSLIY